MLEQDQVTLELPEKQKGKKKAATIYKTTAGPSNHKDGSVLRALQLEEAPKNIFSLTRCHKLRILFGYESILFLLMFLGICGLSYYLFLIYGSSWRWLYFALAIFACSVPIRFVAKIFRAVFSSNKKKEEEFTSYNPKDTTTTTNGNGTCNFFCRGYKIAERFYNEVLEVNGKYFLVKLYISEACENGFRLYNLFTIYLCIMRLRMATILLFVLVVKLAANLWVTFHLTSQIVRDRLLIIDMITDLFCLAFPLCIRWFTYKTPMAIFDTFQIILIPTLFLMNKANDVWCDILEVDFQRIEIKRVATRRRSSRRSSIVALQSNREMFDNQLHGFPKKCRYGFAILNVFLLFFYFAIGIVHLAYHISYLSNGRKHCQLLYTKQIWDQCVLKTPFCNNLFVGRCDCAVLTLKNYTETNFPPSFEGMRSLSTLNVYTGQLEELPDNIGKKHSNLVSISIFRNALKRLPSSASKLKQLLWLRLVATNISEIPNPSRWTSLTKLIITQSKVRVLPENIGSLDMLIILDISNNLVQKLPDSIGSLKNLEYLKIYGNNISELPDSITNLKSVSTMYAHSNTLSKLPENIGDMRELKNIDMSDNSLKELPASMSNLKNLADFYVARNPLCPHYKFPSNLDETEGLCKEQCSVGCQNKWQRDRFCDDNDLVYEYTGKFAPPKANSGCNTAACNYDGGDCSK